MKGDLRKTYHFAAELLRATAREMFEDSELDLDLRDAPWVHTDSYDAGVIAVVKTLLAHADEYEALASRMPNVDGPR